MFMSNFLRISHTKHCYSRLIFDRIILKKIKSWAFWDSVYSGRVSVRLCHVAAAAFRFISATGARAQKPAVRVNAVIPAGSTQTCFKKSRKIQRNKRKIA